MPKHQRRSFNPSFTRGLGSDWRCTCCGKLLGQRHGSVVLVQFARGHQYRSPRPVSAVCRSCDTLNET